MPQPGHCSPVFHWQQANNAARRVRHRLVRRAGAPVFRVRTVRASGHSNTFSHTAAPLGSPRAHGLALPRGLVAGEAAAR